MAAGWAVVERGGQESRGGVVVQRGGQGGEGGRSQPALSSCIFFLVSCFLLSSFLTLLSSLLLAS